MNLHQRMSILTDIRRMPTNPALKFVDFVDFGKPAVESDADLIDPGHPNGRVVAIFRSLSVNETHFSRFRLNASRSPSAMPSM